MMLTFLQKNINYLLDTGNELREAKQDTFINIYVFKYLKMNITF